MNILPVSIDPEVMGGALVFRGTRVLVSTLIDHLESDETIDDFLEGFPSVSCEQVVTFLKFHPKFITSPFSDLVEEFEGLKLSDQQRAALERRLAEHDDDPSSSIPGEVVFAELQARLKNRQRR